MCFNLPDLRPNVTFELRSYYTQILLKFTSLEDACLFLSEFDAEQTMELNLLINIKAWIQLGPLVTKEGGTQVLLYPKSLLVWES